VRYILEGSVRKTGSRVQVNAQLVDASSGAQIWADRVDKEIKDLWELQDHVTGRIAASLDIQLARAESLRVSQSQHSSDADAIDLRLRAMGLYISGINPPNTLAARRLLEQSVQADPNSAEAWAWLADLLASDYLNRWNDAGEEELQQAENAARRALGIDPNLALAHFAYGFVHRARGQNTAALDSFTEALKLNPNFARGYTQKANELINTGKPQDAPPLVQRAIALSPRDPSLGVFYWNLGRAEFFVGNYREAIPWLRKAVELRPNLWHNWLYLASAHALIGNSTEAAKVLSDFNRYPAFQAKNVTIAVVRTYEQANPNNNPVVVEGRRNFHEGLSKAGMAMN
jgi:adenylate cyclase